MAGRLNFGQTCHFNEKSGAVDSCPSGLSTVPRTNFSGNRYSTTDSTLRGPGRRPNFANRPGDGFRGNFRGRGGFNFGRGGRGQHHTFRHSDDIYNCKYWLPSNFPVFFNGDSWLKLHLYPSEPLTITGLDSGVVYCHIRENCVVHSSGLASESHKDIWEIFSGTTTRGISVPTEESLIFKVDPTAKYKPHPSPEPYRIGLEFDRWFQFLNDDDDKESFPWNNLFGKAENKRAHLRQWTGEISPLRVFGADNKDRVVREWLLKFIGKSRGPPCYSLGHLLVEGRKKEPSLRSFHSEEDCSCLDLKESKNQEKPSGGSVQIPVITWGLADDWSESTSDSYQELSSGTEEAPDCQGATSAAKVTKAELNTEADQARRTAIDRSIQQEQLKCYKKFLENRESSEGLSLIHI